MDLGKKIAILLLLLTIGISVKMIVERESGTNTEEIAGQSSSWLYRRPIFVENNDFRTLFEQEISLEIDTKELISKGKLKDDCSDIRFLDQDLQTPLLYRLEESEENACNTNSTIVLVNIPKIELEGRTIFLLYGNKLAPNPFFDNN